jgi:hypothetical protein
MPDSEIAVECSRLQLRADAVLRAGWEGDNIIVTTPATNADKDHDPDLDTIDAPLSMIGKGLLMTAIEAFAAKQAADAGHVFGR